MQPIEQKGLASMDSAGAIRSRVRDIFQASIEQSFVLEWWPLWVRALSHVRFLLTAHRFGLPTKRIWPDVEFSAVALRDHERHGADLFASIGIFNDPHRRELWEALIRVANWHDASYIADVPKQYVGPTREQNRALLLAAAEAFAWKDLPEALYVCPALSWCGQVIGA